MEKDIKNSVSNIKCTREFGARYVSFVVIGGRWHKTMGLNEVINENVNGILRTELRVLQYLKFREIDKWPVEQEKKTARCDVLETM